MKTRYPVRLPRLASPRSFSLAVGGVLAASLLSTGCGEQEQPSLGSDVLGPFALAGQPGTRNVFVLNSAFTGETVDGSILRFELSKDLKRLEKREAVSAPRLGFELQVSPDGKLVAASFGEGEPKLKFYSATPEGALTPLPFEIRSEVGNITNVKFFAPKEAKAGEHFLSFVEDRNSETSRVGVYKVTTQGATKILSLPQDLPNAKPADYSFGYRAPAFEPESGLFFASGNGAEGVVPVLPKSVDFAKGSYDKKATDLRFASMVVVDFPKLLATKDVAGSTAFLPLLMNENWAPYDAKQAPDSERNKSAFFRFAFQSASALNQDGCLGGAASTDPKTPKDSLLLVDDTLEAVVTLTGWAEVKKQLDALPVLKGVQHKERLITSLPKGGLYSLKRGVSGLDVEEPTLINEIKVVKAGADCVPVWLRNELRRASPGNELSRLQTNFKRAGNDPLRLEVPVRGSRSFGALSVGSGEAARAFVFTASYSFGDVLGFELKRSGQTYDLSPL